MRDFPLRVAWSMHIRNFMVHGLHCRDPPGEPRIAWDNSLVLIPYLPDPPDEDSCAGLHVGFNQHNRSVFLNPHRPFDCFPIGNMTPRFHEPGMRPPKMAALAMPRCDFRTPTGTSRSMLIVTPLSPCRLPFGNILPMARPFRRGGWDDAPPPLL